MRNKLVIQVENLAKNFGDIVAVKDISLNVHAGEIFGVLGPNGSGKTTTLRMLCGLLHPDNGRGTCLSYDLLNESQKIKDNVGYMTQRFSLYQDMSVIENLEFIENIYGVKNKKNKIQNVIKEFELQDIKKSLTGSLSGGWKQRVALAGCLLHEPKLLLLDEPTAGVDPRARRDFWDKISLLSHNGITTLVSTHYMDEAERCSQLAYIAKGELITQGGVKDIIHDSKLLTFRISGDNINKISAYCEEIEAIEQFVFFGKYLHVSGQDHDELLNSIESMQGIENYKYMQVDTSLEDVFIYLSSKSKKRDV